MASLYEKTFVDELRQGAAGLVADWGLSPQTEVTLLNLSENATFCADDPKTGERLVLRVHRPDYHRREEIASELAWIEALRGAEIVATPKPLPTTDGRAIASFTHGAEARNVVAFQFMSGSEPSPDEDLTEGFFELGKISARLHRHAREWQRPDGFCRKSWHFDTMIGASPLWGDWREALGLEGEGKALLERTSLALKEALSRYGAGPDRFGLIHADLRLANLLIDDGRLAVIDFDDCGFSWFIYDFAAAISFIEEDPLVPALQEAWIAGYRRVGPLPQEDVAVIPTMIMLRRLLLTAWIASHSETPTAQEMGVGYTEGTLRLAEHFLSSVRP